MDALVLRLAAAALWLLGLVLRLLLSGPAALYRRLRGLGDDVGEDATRGPRCARLEPGTDAEVIPKPPWRERKEKYIAHIGSVSASVRLVSAADKLHNARSILADYRQLGESLWNRFKGGKEGTLWYYRSLIREFQAAGGGQLAEELDRVVTELERLSTV